MSVKLSKRVIDSVQPIKGQDQWLWDAELKGFGLRVRPSGRKVYIVEYRPGGGGRKAPKRRYTIGSHGSPWAPDTARTEAKRILGLAAAGKDPAADRTEARRREGDTVEALAEAFIEKYAKREQRSWQETERVLKRDINPAIGRKLIDDVTRQDVVRLIDTVADRGVVMGARTHAYLRRFFNWCLERGYIKESPVAGLKAPGRAQDRDRVLSDSETLEVWRAIDSLGSLWGPMVKLLLLTGQRLNEVAGMRWSEIDTDSGTWVLPAARTKNKREHEVPLTETARSVLAAIPRMSIEYKPVPLVFTTTGRTPMSGFSSAKRALDKAILEARQSEDPEAKPMPHWTFHDLRRTVTTGLARLGIHPHVADALLNHKSGAITGVAAVYNRHAYLDERRRALEAWEAHVLALTQAQVTEGNVVVLAQRNASSLGHDDVA